MTYIVASGKMACFMNWANCCWRSFFSLVIGAALLAWGLKKKGVFKRKHEQKERVLAEEDFKAAGVNYYESNIHNLACETPDWKAAASKIISEGKRIVASTDTTTLTNLLS